MSLFCVFDPFAEMLNLLLLFLLQFRHELVADQFLVLKIVFFISISVQAAIFTLKW